MRGFFRPSVERQPEYVGVNRVLPPGQPGSIAGEGRVLSVIAGGRQPFGRATFSRNPEQTAFAAMPGRKDDLPPVRSPGQIADAGAVESQPLRFAAVHGDQVYIANQRADHAHERQLFAVRRKSRTAIADDGQWRGCYATSLSSFGR